MAEPKHTNTAHELGDERHRLILHFYEDEHPPEDGEPERGDLLSVDIEVYVHDGHVENVDVNEDPEPIFHQQYWLKFPEDPTQDPIRNDLQQVGLAEPLVEETMRTVALLTELWDTLRHPEDAHL